MRATVPYTHADNHQVTPNTNMSQVISMWLEGNCPESGRLYPANVMHMSQVISMWLEGNCPESGRLYPANMMHMSQVISMWLEGNCHEFRKAVPSKWSRLGAAAKVAGTVISPMPGKIIQVISC